MRLQHSTLHAALVATLGGFAACGGDPSGGPPPETPAITGVDRIIHWDETGGSHVVGRTPDDVYIEAELSAEDVRPATMAEDGSFAIAGSAPDGPYWLRIVDGRLTRSDLYVLTDATDLDLGFDFVGDDSRLSQTDTTRLVVDATGLAAWQDTDDGDFVIPGLGFQSTIATFYASNTPIAGDTSLNALTYVWQSLPLPESSQATPAMFVQVRPAHDDALGLDYDAPVKVFRSDVAITQGATTRITGVFADAPAFDVPLQWMRSAFAAQADAMHPATCQHTLDTESYWVHALPGHGAHGELERTFYDQLAGIPEFGPRLVDEVNTFDETDLVGTLHVTNPYPADWLYAKYELSYAVQCPVAGGNPPGNATAAIGVVAELGTTAVVPLVGPVGAPQIDGRDLLVPQTGVGLAPTIRWTAPALGTATSYELHLSEVRVGGGFNGGLVLREDAELIVPGKLTTVTLPRDVLVAGTPYVLRIRAITRGGQQAASAPFRSGMPLGYSDLYTNYFQP